MIDMSQVEGKVKASSVQKISELVTNHPAETVAVIRSWMSQEG
jgi:flagellar M-ring protein FliF